MFNLCSHIQNISVIIFQSTRPYIWAVGAYNQGFGPLYYPTPAHHCLRYYRLISDFYMNVCVHLITIVMFTYSMTLSYSMTFVFLLMTNCCIRSNILQFLIYFFSFYLKEEKKNIYSPQVDSNPPKYKGADTLCARPRRERWRRPHI